MTTPPHDFACTTDTPTAELIEYMRKRGLLARSAFIILCRRHQPTIWNRLIKMRGVTPAVAENLMQEAFTRLWVHSPDLDPSTNVEAWTWTVARRLALDYFGSATYQRDVSLQEKRRDEDGNTFSLEDTLPSKNTSFEDEVCNRVILEEAFKQLGISQLDQDLLIRFHRDKYRQSELADAYDLTDDQVQKRISETRKKVRNYLRDDFRQGTMRKESSGE